jgi:hypothetical protein
LISSEQKIQKYPFLNFILERALCFNKEKIEFYNENVNQGNKINNLPAATFMQILMSEIIKKLLVFEGNNILIYETEKTKFENHSFEIAKALLEDFKF